MEVTALRALVPALCAVMAAMSCTGSRSRGSRPSRAIDAGARGRPAARRAGLPPNIVIVLTDDQGMGDLGAFGARDVRTPRLDALAASGARLTSWYASSSTCSPSRASILTGRYPSRAGVPDIVRAGRGVTGLPESEITLAELTRARGYRSALVGKWHLGSASESLPNAQGFERFFGFLSGFVDYYSHVYPPGVDGAPRYHDLWRDGREIRRDGRYMTELVTEEATRFIDDAKSEPFLLVVAYSAPHYPMQAPARYLARFRGLSPERAMHAAMIAAVDDGVGAIVDRLDANRLREHTFIFFQSDNGATNELSASVRPERAGAPPGGSNAPFSGYKFSLFEGGIRVPAIASWPGTIPAGRAVGAVGIGMDVFATAARIAGAELPRDRTIDGRDVLPMLARGAASPHDVLFWAQGDQRAVRRGRYKLVVGGVLGAREDDTLEADDSVFLADLEADPGETRNLRRAEPALARELRALITGWERAVRAR